MARNTVMIGAMKPMTRGHYQLIQKAVQDDMAPKGVEANKTYVLVSVQDRIKKGQFPVKGETAIQALRDFYASSEQFLSFASGAKWVELIFCYSGKFARDNPERIEIIRSLVNDIEARLNDSNLNCSVSFVEVASGPPSFLLDLAESSPEDKFVLYTGEDDIPKYRTLFNKKYVPNENIEIAGYQRFEGGVSGTEVRSIFDTDNPSPEEKERLQQALPDFVNPKSVYDFYRTQRMRRDDLVLKPSTDDPKKTKDYKLERCTYGDEDPEHFLWRTWGDH